MDEIHLMMEQGTAYAAILMPVLITWVILYYSTRDGKR